MSKARSQLEPSIQRSRSAKSDDDVSFLRDVREKRLYQIGGCQPPATPSGPPLTNTLQLHATTLPQKWDRLESPPTAGLAPKGHLTYLEHCGNCATTNSRRTMSGPRGRRGSQI
jgi:hypothetical protein